MFGSMLMVARYSAIIHASVKVLPTIVVSIVSSLDTNVVGKKSKNGKKLFLKIKCLNVLEMLTVGQPIGVAIGPMDTVTYSEIAKVTTNI